jgi:peptidoglycan/xylan/chitin deacetylase (PgdA/CDA1 family)
MHLVTLSFDDGMLESSVKTAEIHEKYGLSACFNVVATGHHPDFVWPTTGQAGPPLGDFKLWNALQARGHEIMPHGYKHARKSALPFQESQQLIQDCLAIFAAELAGFDARQSIFNFPYNASTPELEQWLPTVVKAFRTIGPGINPLPHPGQTRLTTTGFGPGNCEKHLDQNVAELLAQSSGWLIYNLHGLDDEGWGPIGSDYLDKLLERLLSVPSVKILPAGQALNLQP